MPGTAVKVDVDAWQWGENSPDRRVVEICMTNLQVVVATMLHVTFVAFPTLNGY